jgi:N-ethylmaleimide reductase
MSSHLWTPLKVGALELPHRLVMAPMTRARSTPEGVPSEMNVEYYAQRASLALIITEGTQPSDDGQGYPLTPGIYRDDHVAGWRLVTNAVHDAGGRIVIQLMHVGRIAHPSNTPHGRQPVAPSTVRPSGSMFTAAGPLEMPEPRELSTSEIRVIVDEHRRSAVAAMAAGADGVEVHAANGYLAHQFLSTNANLRNDDYGGSVQRRIRFAVELVDAVATEIGRDRTGVVISPGNPLNDIIEDDVEVLYGVLVRALSSLQPAYLNLSYRGDGDMVEFIRLHWPGVLFLNRGDADLETRLLDVESGLADAVTVGTHALANPDLVERLRSGAPLNVADRSTFYGGGERGYLDYPTLMDTRAAETSSL